MDKFGLFWYYSDVNTSQMHTDRIPSWNLYGEAQTFPDVLHCEKIVDRAKGLDWTISPHRHPHLHQFFLIMTGGLEMTADHEHHVINRPCVLSIPRNTVHGFSFPAGTEGYVTTIPIQYLPDIYDPQSVISAALSDFAIVEAAPNLVALVEDIYHEHGGRGLGRSNLLRALASQLACHVIRLLPDTKSAADKHSDPKFQQFEELAKAHFRDNLKLTDYAANLGVSPRHLGRICRAETGQSPSQYLDTVTMQEACRLLVYTRNSIAAIGYLLGFDDPSYFSRVFRRHMGSTPRAYRAAFEQE